VLQRPHFLPLVKPRSVAQTAHCVRIIVLIIGLQYADDGASVLTH